MRLTLLAPFEDGQCALPPCIDTAGIIICIFVDMGHGGTGEI